MESFMIRASAKLILRFIFLKLFFIMPLAGQSSLSVNSIFKDKKIAALVHSVKKGNMKKAAKLIEAGADINGESEEGITPLYYFFLKKDYKSFKRMLELGADPNVNPAGSGFYRLINASIRVKDDRYCKLLLQYKVDLNYQWTSEAEPPLRSALYSSVDSKYLRLLLEHGMDLSYSEYSTYNPVITVLHRHDYEKALILLEFGADFSNDEQIKTAAVQFLESRNCIYKKGSRTLKELQKFVAYLEKQYGIKVNLMYPEGK